MPCNAPHLWACLLLLLYSVLASTNRISGRVGDTAELSCLREGKVSETPRQVNWSRTHQGVDQQLASVSVGEGEWPVKQVTLIYDSVLHLLLHNVSWGDAGGYLCVDGNGSMQATLVCIQNHTGHVGLSEGTNASWTCEGLGPQRVNVLRSTCLGPGDTANLTCPQGAKPPFHWLHHPGRGRCSPIFGKVSLRPGYGLRLRSGWPVLILPSLRLQQSGYYSCSANGLNYSVELLVQRSGILDFLMSSWIPLTTVSLTVCVYALCVTLSFTLRRKRQLAAHQMRIARLISFFRRNGCQENQVNSKNGSRDLRSRHRTSVTTGSGSTWYENVGSFDSRGGGVQEDANAVDVCDGNLEGGISYENLEAVEENHSEDYLNPESDAGSASSEDYLNPESDAGSASSEDYLNPESDAGSASSEGRMKLHANSGTQETTKAQVLYTADPLWTPPAVVSKKMGEDMVYAIPSGKSRVSLDSEGDYMNPDSDVGPFQTKAEIHCATDAEVYEPMSRQVNSYHKEQSNSDDEDYEKMESSDYSNVPAAGSVQMSEEGAQLGSRLMRSSENGEMSPLVPEQVQGSNLWQQPAGRCCGRPEEPALNPDTHLDFTGPNPPPRLHDTLSTLHPPLSLSPLPPRLSPLPISMTPSLPSLSTPPSRLYHPSPAP
ncbi:uncharacterized protein [Hemitrygon akajei]|uniref:uncharacterized protein isoform X3 n=1 Tax=Hemitrygon akajei TaxID=2704970 RepID=UPI003BF946B9